jgi:hypothetical protein
MKKYSFLVEFLTDIVLPASSNNEGKILNLEFIPGSAFLGIVAKNYDKFENSFDVFHSGKVRFLDGHIRINNKPSFKIPFSFFRPKTQKSEEKMNVENHHLIKEFNPNVQLKQIRKGFMNIDGEYLELNYNYKQKSAYDTKKRTSKEGAMFGYASLEKGTKWSFSIKIDTSISKNDEELILNSIVGIKQLGKSKSAEYGKVKITKIDEENIPDNFSYDKNNETFLYLNSRLALFDKNGYPTLIPTITNLGLSSGKIVWKKSQIRTLTFSPYNTARKTKDYTRAVIEKGSVIVIEKLTEEDKKKLKNGVGGFLSEGYGEILINPKFLTTSSPKLEKFEEREEKEVDEKNEDKNLIAYLENRREEKNEMFELLESVNEFIKKNKSSFKDVTKSQWGQIRNLSNKENVVEEISNFIDHGIKKDVWKNGKISLIPAIKQAKDKNKFTKLVAMQMQKEAKK